MAQQFWQLRVVCLDFLLQARHDHNPPVAASVFILEEKTNNVTLSSVPRTVSPLPHPA
jgi:hypothetical protein